MTLEGLGNQGNKKLNAEQRWFHINNFFNFSYRVFKWSGVLGKLLAPCILSAYIDAKFGWLRISLYFSGMTLGKISSKHVPRLWTELALGRNRRVTSQYGAKKASNLIVLPLQGGVNTLSFPRTCFAGWQCACKCVSSCCSSWSLAGKLFWGQRWECWWWGGRAGRQRIIASCLQFTQSQEVLKSQPCLSSPLLFNLHRSLASESCSANRTK